MEGLGPRSRLAPALAWLGLALLALGMAVYAGAGQEARQGLLAALAGLACLGAAAILGRRRLGLFLSSRAARLGLGAGASLVIALALAVFLGALFSRHHLRLDLSKDARHTLSPQSVQVLAKLEQPVKAYAFFREGQSGRQSLSDLLQQYAYHSRQFSHQFVDPDREPGLAKRFEVRAYGSVVLALGDKYERARSAEEQDLTGALMRLVRPGGKHVYLLGGHGEASPEDRGPQGLEQFKQAVAQQNYLVKPLLLAASGQVPAEAALLVVAGPRKPLLPAEVGALEQYLNQGGGLLLLLGPGQEGGLTGWLARQGVTLQDDLVLDPASSLVGASPAWPIVSEYGSHPLARPLEGLFSYFPLTRSLSLSRPLPGGRRGAEILQTSPTAWGSVDPKVLETGQASFQEGRDRKGPLYLGAVLEPADPPAPAEPRLAGRLAVVGNAGFIANQHLGQGGNRDLALNLVGHLAEDQEQMAIRPRASDSQPLLLNSSQALLVLALPVVAIPLTFLILGIVVTRARRRPA